MFFWVALRQAKVLLQAKSYLHVFSYGPQRVATGNESEVFGEDTDLENVSFMPCVVLSLEHL
jgi:hypothetical protein